MTTTTNSRTRTAAVLVVAATLVGAGLQAQAGGRAVVRAENRVTPAARRLVVHRVEAGARPQEIRVTTDAAGRALAVDVDGRPRVLGQASHESRTEDAGQEERSGTDYLPGVICPEPGVCCGWVYIPLVGWVFMCD